MRKYILCLLLISVSGQIANAGTFEQGMQFFEQQNYAQAKKLWQPLAKDGDARAQYNLALIIFNHEKNEIAQSQLRRQKASQYLAMSRANGLVDSYLLKMPMDVSSAIKSDNKNSDITESLSWLNQQKQTNYTLQLATGKNRDGMKKLKQKLIDSQSLEQPENLYIHDFKRKEQDKIIINYILIYGTFKSNQLAKNEVEKLPESIQKLSPWIRQFGKLQSKVNGRQKKNNSE